MNIHDIYIKRAIQLAKKGIGITRPNPAVGAVIVYRNTIIGEGFTSSYGGNHAEVNAIAAVKNKELLSEATLYVTLEPCAHFGKTPPCSNLIVSHKIPNVVIGCIDTNSLVAGKGIEILKKGGCNVIVGVLETLCKEHHKRFFTVHNKNRPYIFLKWAETQDGFIAPETKSVQQPVWISNTYSQQLVHKLRANEQAILVGTNTVMQDNPKLNVRSWHGNNPIRVALDKNLRITKEMSILDGSIPTIIITDIKVLINKEVNKQYINSVDNLILESIDFSSGIAEQIIKVLQNHKIQSIIIEGGKQTLEIFINANLWDEAAIFKGKGLFKTGVRAPKINGNLILENNIDTDILKIYKND